MGCGYWWNHPQQPSNERHLILYKDVGSTGGHMDQISVRVSHWIGALGMLVVLSSTSACRDAQNTQIWSGSYLSPLTASNSDADVPVTVSINCGLNPVELGQFTLTGSPPCPGPTSVTLNATFDGVPISASSSTFDFTSGNIEVTVEICWNSGDNIQNMEFQIIQSSSCT